MGATLFRSALALPLFVAAFSLGGSTVSAQSTTCVVIIDQFATKNVGVRMLQVQGTFHVASPPLCAKAPPGYFLHMNYDNVSVPGFDFPIGTVMGQEQTFGPVVLQVPATHPVLGKTPLTFYAQHGDAAQPDQKTSPITIEFFQPS
jgi:hypothetical protein